MTKNETTNTAPVAITKGGIVFTGDGITLYQASQLRSFLKLYAKTGMIPTRGVTITKMLKMASTFTGKTYKRGDAMKAHEDMHQWVEAAKASMPIEDHR